MAPRRRVGEEAASERRAVLGRRRPIALPLQRLSLTLEAERSISRALVTCLAWTGRSPPGPLGRPPVRISVQSYGN